jgi:hypothetical protein
MKIKKSKTVHSIGPVSAQGLGARPSLAVKSSQGAQATCAWPGSCAVVTVRSRRRGWLGLTDGQGVVGEVA